MSHGLPTRRPRLFPVLFLAWLTVALACLSGCGGQDQEEAATQQKPRALVPGGAPDSAQVDTVITTETESVYQAGTLPTAEGVTGANEATETEVPEVVTEIKAAPVETKAPQEPSATRPATTVSSGNGSYSLQLGSFTNVDNARKQADRLRALGYAPVIEESNLGGQVYHRVMLRSVGDMAEASRLGEYIHSELGIAYLVRRGH